MSVFLILYLVLVLGALLRLLKNNQMAFKSKVAKNKRIDSLYLICITFMFILLAFRYGQGEDYYNYKSIYKYAKNYDLRNLAYYMQNERFEVGWIIINRIAYITNIGFTGLCICLALIEILLIDRFLKYFRVHNKPLTLLLLLPSFYYVFLFSGMRQGLVMSIFAGILLPLLVERKIIIYILLVICTAQFHTMAYMYILLAGIVFGYDKYFESPKITQRNPKITFKSLKIFLTATSLILCIIGYLLYELGVVKQIYERLPVTISGHFNLSMSIGAILYRLTMLMIMIFISKVVKENRVNNILIFCYLIAVNTFFALSGVTLLANRLFVLIGIVIEAVFIDEYIKESRKRNNALILVMILVVVCGGVYVKNINARIENTRYLPSSTNIFDYRWDNIFSPKNIENYKYTN